MGLFGEGVGVKVGISGVSIMYKFIVCFNLFF